MSEGDTLDKTIQDKTGLRSIRWYGWVVLVFWSVETLLGSIQFVREILEPWDGIMALLGDVSSYFCGLFFFFSTLAYLQKKKIAVPGLLLGAILFSVGIFLVVMMASGKIESEPSHVLVVFFLALALFMVLLVAAHLACLIDMERRWGQFE